MFLKKPSLFFTLIAIILFFNTASAQDKPIGFWRSLLPYDTASALATNGTKIYIASGEGFFTYDVKNGNEETYSKVEGMSDEGTEFVVYDAATNATTIIYSDANIDIFKNNTFYNIPDFQITAVAGTKVIYSAFDENGFVYLSTSVGVIVIDLTNLNISENYQFNLKSNNLSIYSYTSDQNNFYAVTSHGVYSAPKNSPDLQNFQVWTNIDSTHAILYSTKIDNQVFFADYSIVYALTNDTLKKIFNDNNAGYNIESIDGGLNRLMITKFGPTVYNGYVKILDMNYNLVDSIVSLGKPRQSIQLLDSSIWVADAYFGLSKKQDSSANFFFTPPGPGDPNSFDIFAYNKNVWVAHGGFNDLYINNGDPNGLSNLVDGSWNHYQRFTYNPFWDSCLQFVSILVDEQDTTLYAGSFGGGLFELHPNGNWTIYKQNSILQTSVPNPGQYAVAGLGLDASDNLWVSMFGSYDELYCKEKSSGNWYAYHYNFNTYYPNTGGQIAFDQAGDVWVAALYGGGLICYNTNGTLSNTADDKTYQLLKGVGYGNLPSGNTFCLAVDKTDNLWVGTDNGIGIVYNASSCLGSQCQATIPIVQYDAYAGYLFASENVHTIAVDGANRKWVGTDNGVWLLSPDASTIIYKFNTANSPLPSNVIQKISIDNITGDVYIGTTQGLVSFRSTATNGGTTNQNVLVFPDPVPSGYTGTIAIRGLVANADVRITDIKGELVYKTTALGGQAVWNGLDYKGRRPDSGVYLVFVSSSDGSQTYTGKFVFLQ